MSCKEPGDVYKRLNDDIGVVLNCCYIVLCEPIKQDIGRNLCPVQPDTADGEGVRHTVPKKYQRVTSDEPGRY